MYKSTLAIAVAAGVLAQTAGAAGFIDDSKVSVSSRTMYFDNDNRDGGTDQREWAQGFKLDALSGFTEGTVGFGVDVQAITGIHLDGGRGSRGGNPNTTARFNNGNSFFPSDTDGSAEHTFSRIGGNVKARFSKTEVHVGSALAPSLPILVSNDGRLLPQTFDGGVLTSKEIDNVTLAAGQIEHAYGRASSNRTGLGVNGGTLESNKFRFVGGDWKVTKDLTLQYYYANLEDYYKQHFGGLVHVLPISDGQSFKTDLRVFKSSSDGKNGDVGYRFNNNSGYAKNPGEVDNTTWSAAFTYSLGGHAIMLGHQQVSDDGGMVFVNQGSIAGENGGGASVYLLTDVMANSFTRAGENTTFGQYSYDFAKAGIPGLKASATYLYGKNATLASGAEFNEWERDVRIDYVIQSGVLKGLGTSLRQGTYRPSATSLADVDQTRLIFNYTYAFK